MLFGGTEIKPPPGPPPCKSPSKTARASPSPTRPKAPAANPGTAENASDLQKLTAVLEGAFKANRGWDSRVEDVKAVPELPRLEIKTMSWSLILGLLGIGLLLSDLLFETCQHMLVNGGRKNRILPTPFTQSG